MDNSTEPPPPKKTIASLDTAHRTRNDKAFEAKKIMRSDYIYPTPLPKKAELFNIPDWDCPDTVKAPFFEGLERSAHSISHPVAGSWSFKKSSLGLC